MHYVLAIWPSFCTSLFMDSTSKIRRFEDLIVFQKAMTLSKEISSITFGGKFSKGWGLRDQIRRASVSILSNVAEGFGRYSNQEFKKYLAIANGSSFEVRAQLHLVRELGYVDELEVERLIQVCTEISMMIGGLRRKVK